MNETLKEAIERFCTDGQPNNVWRQMGDTHGTYIVRIENQTPVHIYALIEGNSKFNNMSEALNHIEDNLGLDGVDLWGFSVRIEWDNVIPYAMTDEELCHDPWPSEVVHLIEHLAEKNDYFYQIHVSNISYT